MLWIGYNRLTGTARGTVARSGIIRTSGYTGQSRLHRFRSIEFRDTKFLTIAHAAGLPKTGYTLLRESVISCENAAAHIEKPLDTPC